MVSDLLTDPYVVNLNALIIGAVSGTLEEWPVIRAMFPRVPLKTRMAELREAVLADTILLPKGKPLSSYDWSAVSSEVCTD